MVILENTKTQLKFRHRPYSYWLGTSGWLLGTFLLILLIYDRLNWLSNLLWLPPLLLFMVVGGGLAIVFGGRVVICHFDKDDRSLTIELSGLLGTKVIWHSLADVLDVQLQSTSWHRHEAADCQITVVLKSGESLILNLGLNSIERKLETINLIRKFLGMPPERWR